MRVYPFNRAVKWISGRAFVICCVCLTAGLARASLKIVAVYFAARDGPAGSVAAKPGPAKLFGLARPSEPGEVGLREVPNLINLAQSGPPFVYLRARSSSALAQLESAPSHLCSNSIKLAFRGPLQVMTERQEVRKHKVNTPASATYWPRSALKLAPVCWPSAKK